MASNPATSKLPNHPLWEFSLSLYALPHVEHACLELQNRHSININILLFCCWVAKTGYGQLSAQDLQAAILNTQKWNKTITFELRKLRKQISNTENNTYNALRKSILDTELCSEHIEQTMLFDHIKRHCPEQVSPSTGAIDAIANLATYSQLRELTLDTEDHQRLFTLITATFPENDVDELKNRYQYFFQTEKSANLS